jgi:hypothetical protein
MDFAAKDITQSTKTCTANVQEHHDFRLISLGIFASRITNKWASILTTGGINPRTSVRLFRQGPNRMQRAGAPVRDLSIQALRKFQDTDQTEVLSWFLFNGWCIRFV